MTTPGSPIDAVKDLLLWARKNRMAFARVTVGEVTVEVVDMAPSSGNVDVSAPPDVGNLYRTFGGDAVAEALAQEESAIGVIEDDDDEVAIDEKPRRRR